MDLPTMSPRARLASTIARTEGFETKWGAPDHHFFGASRAPSPAPRALKRVTSACENGADDDLASTIARTEGFETF